MKERRTAANRRRRAHLPVSSRGVKAKFNSPAELCFILLKVTVVTGAAIIISQLLYAVSP